jgi:hypothetical protein
MSEDFEDIPEEGEDAAPQTETDAALEDSGSGEESDQEDEEQYEGTPEELTALPGNGPPRFDRKKVMMFIVAGFSIIILFSLILNSGKDKKKKEEKEETYASSADVPADFLSRERDNAYSYSPVMCSASVFH